VVFVAQFAEQAGVGLMAMEESDWEKWFGQVWEDREERIYRELFGESTGGIYTLTSDIFMETFRQESVDPRWLFYGVLVYPPTAERASWLYATSGMSNAWDDDQPDPNGVSGIGCEFIFETTEFGEWAILLVQKLMAYQILLAHDRYEGREVIGWYERVSLRASIKPDCESAIRNLLIAPPTTHPEEIKLASGEVVLLQLAGITDEEAQFSRENGCDRLIELLQAANAFPLTDPQRGTINLPG
jgi:hypothetical protein